MVLDAFRSASPKAKVLNVLFIVFNFLAWVSTCVGFGGILFNLEVKVVGGDPVKFDFRWNKVHNPSITLEYSSSDCSLDFCDKCKTGGRGFIAFQVFAFLGLTFVLFLSIVRFLGVSISKLEPTRKVLFGELVLTAINMFCLFLSVCIFGGTCFHAATKFDNSTITGTGFGFTIACFFFLVINLVFIYLIRADSAAHLGSAGGNEYTNESDPNTTNYNPPASYQYAQDPAAAAYAGSYNGDVMPQA